MARWAGTRNLTRPRVGAPVIVRLDDAEGGATLSSNRSVAVAWMSRLPTLTITLIVSLTPGPACRRARSECVVATVNEVVIRCRDLQEVLAAIPSPIRHRYRTPDGRKALLDHTISVELLAAEAQRTGLGGGKAADRAAKERMARLLSMSHGRPLPEQGLEESVSRYYREHYDEFHKNDARRVLDVVVADRRLADRLSAHARSVRKSDRRKDQASFEDLARGWTRDGTATVRDLGFLSARPGDISKALVDAAFALDSPGAVSAPVDVEGSIHILKLLDIRTGYSRPFAAVKREIADFLAREAENRRLAGLAADLRKRANIRIDERALRAVDLTLSYEAPP